MVECGKGGVGHMKTMLFGLSIAAALFIAGMSTNNSHGGTGLIIFSLIITALTIKFAEE
jgi:hypothetical protein